MTISFLENFFGDTEQQQSLKDRRTKNRRKKKGTKAKRKYTPGSRNAKKLAKSNRTLKKAGQPILDHQDFLDVYPDHDVILTRRGNYLTLDFSDDMPITVAQDLNGLKAQFGEMGTAQKRYCSFNVPPNYCPSKTGDRIADHLELEGLTVRRAVKPQGEMARKFAPKTTKRFAKAAAKLLVEV